MGCFIAGKHYTSEEMQETGTVYLKNGNDEAEIDLTTLPPKNIGMTFLFFYEDDVMAFKLKWT